MDVPLKVVLQQGLLGQELIHKIPVDVSEAMVATLVLEGQFLVIDAE